MANAFKWVVGLAIVAYVGVTLFIKVVQSERTQKMDPALVKTLDQTMSELEACKETNEKLRQELAKSVDSAP